MTRIRAALSALVFSLATVSGGQALAQTLTLIDETGSEPVVTELTMEEVEALGSAEISTSTTWTEGEIAFSGVPLSAIAALIDGPFTEVEARALNDFSVFLPVSDFDEGAAILATRADGEVMSVRDRGPFWVMFDFDTLDGADEISAEQRSIWQLSTLTFR